MKKRLLLFFSLLLLIGGSMLAALFGLSPHSSAPPLESSVSVAAESAQSDNNSRPREEWINQMRVMIYDLNLQTRKTREKFEETRYAIKKKEQEWGQAAEDFLKELDYKFRIPLMRHEENCSYLTNMIERNQLDTLSQEDLENIDKAIHHIIYELPILRSELEEFRNKIERFTPDSSNTPAPPVGEGLITMTTAKEVGQRLLLRIEANGGYEVEGAIRVREERKYNYTYTLYQLTSQQVTLKGDVTVLACDENELTSLDLSKNTSLLDLNCYRNNLASLDVSKNTQLVDLNCSNNLLTSLDLSQNTQLKYLACYYNRIQGEAMNQLVTSLPKAEGELYVLYGCGVYDNAISQAQVKMAKEKGWRLDTNGIGNDRISFTTNKAVGEKITLFVEIDDEREGFRILGGRCVSYRPDFNGEPFPFTFIVTEPNQTFTIEGNTSGLYARQNSIVSVEGSTYVGARRMTSGGVGTLSAQADEVVKASSHLRVLDVADNELKSLSLAQLPNLEVMRCDNNQLSQLNVSAQTKLKELNCANNQIRGKEMDALIASFPKDAEAKGKFIVVSATEDAEKGNQISKTQVAKAEEMGWKPLLTRKPKDDEGNASQGQPQPADEATEPFTGADIATDIEVKRSEGAQDAITVFDLSGRRIDARRAKGVVIVKRGHHTTKQAAR